MKPTMLFAIVLIAAIILASSFGLHIMPLEPVNKLSAELAGKVLYVCPAANQIWDSVAMGLRPYARYINMFFLFAAMLLTFSWGWALYQNLLKDSFKQDAFQSSWAMTKALFWVVIIVTVLIATPSYFRGVHVTGAEGNWVLCEENTPGALPVLSDAVKR